MKLTQEQADFILKEFGVDWNREKKSVWIASCVGIFMTEPLILKSKSYR